MFNGITGKATVGISPQDVWFEADCVPSPNTQDVRFDADCVPSPNTQDVRFDADCVLHQLQHLRVLDTALIQSCGYSVQMTFADFLSRYSSSILRETELEVTGDNCRRILQVSRLQEWQIGHTKVHMIEPQVEPLV